MAELHRSEALRRMVAKAITSSGVQVNQVTPTPFVSLNVDAVQYEALFRYQAWS